MRKIGDTCRIVVDDAIACLGQGITKEESNLWLRILNDHGIPILDGMPDRTDNNAGSLRATRWRFNGSMLAFRNYGRDAVAQPNQKRRI